MPIQFYGASQSAAIVWEGTETITGQKTFSDTIKGDISSNGTSYFTDICANSIIGDISSNGTSYFTDICANSIVGDISSNGTSYFTDICANNIVGDISSNGTSYFTDICANRIYSNPDAGQALIIDSSLIIPNGNVGIGISNPESALHVVGNRNNQPSTKGIHMGGNTDYAIEICAAAEDANSYIDFTRAGEDFGGRILYHHHATDAYKDYMAFHTRGNIDISYTRINGYGNVGIRWPDGESWSGALGVNGIISMRKAQNIQTSPIPLGGLLPDTWYFNPQQNLEVTTLVNASAHFVGYFQWNSSNGDFDFTGQHRCILNKNLDETSKGLIVSSTGKYININNSLNTNINESLPICNITNTDNDKKVFGVISDKEDTNSNRDYSTGNFVSCFEKTNKNEQRMFINSLGEGAIWVCNKNGNVENGDYISSSSVAGYGMKQTLNEDCLTRYTVAKITCDCDFSLTKIVKQKLKVINQSDSSGNAYTDIDYDTNGDVQYEDDLDANGSQQMIFPFETRFLQADATQITEAEYNSKLGASEEVYIACFVGCTYHCG